MNTGSADRLPSGPMRPARSNGRDDRVRLLLMTNSVAVGGMEEHVRLIAQELDRSRFEVHAVLPDWSATNDWAPALGAAADTLTFLTPDRRHGASAQVRELWRLVRFARANRFDVAHVHGTSYHGLSLTILALRLAGVRRICLTEHLAPEEPQSRRLRLMRAGLSRMLSVLVAVSENNRDARVANLGMPACPIEVVNNGIDVSRFDSADDPASAAALREEIGIDPGALVVGTAIRLEADKGVDDLVRAFALVRERHGDAELLIVGDGSQRLALEALAEQCGVADHTRFVGFQPAPQPYIRLMDVFVLPVPFGSASIGLLEAMAMSRPCVITFGGRKEAVVHDECGYCAAPRDPASLAHHIGLLLDDDERRMEFGRKSRERVEREYSAVRVARHLEVIYGGSMG